MNWTITLIFMFFLTAFQAPSFANEKFTFEQIMEMMEGADVRYKRTGHYSNIPFKLEKKGKKWRLTQMQNSYRGTITSAGDNKIRLNGFGSGWTIVGTWDFKKDGDTCRIDHTLKDSTGSEPMEMVWVCKLK